MSAIHRFVTFVARLTLWGWGLLTVTTAQAEFDLNGTYDVGTLTPLERPEMYGDKLLLSKAEATVLEERFRKFQQQANQSSDPNRSAPEAGARVGGYNMFWLDRGDTAVSIDGKFRTSIITHPKNGRMPEMTKVGAARMQQLQDQWRLLWRSQDLAASQNTGTAWWLSNPGGTGPYDDIEQRPTCRKACQRS